VPVGVTIVHPDTGNSWQMGEAPLAKRLIDPDSIKVMSDNTFKSVLDRLGLSYEQATGKSLPQEQIVTQEASAEATKEALTEE
jgi:hypothetical protein